MLKTMQPFDSDSDANYLGWINRLARIDRHRHLNHMTAYLAEMEPVIVVPHGYTTTLQWGERLLREGVADVARIVVTPWHPGIDVQVNPRFGIDPEIDAWSGSEFWKRVTYSERFRMLQVFVTAEIAIYEYDCTGISRKADLLTESYKTECDNRSTAKAGWPTRTREPVVWTEPRAGKPTTQERFDGSDFPANGPRAGGLGAARPALSRVGGSLRPPSLPASLFSRPASGSLIECRNHGRTDIDLR
jgi:hypothetical protein